MTTAAASLASSTSLSSAEDRERTFFFDHNGDETDDVDAALTSVRILDRSPSAYTGIVEVYGSDGATFTHEYEWYPAGRDVPALDDDGYMNEAKSALEHMSKWSTGEKATVLIDHNSDWVWHVAEPGTSGIDAAKEVDRQNSVDPRRYSKTRLDSGDHGYNVHLVPSVLVDDLEGQNSRDTALVKLFEMQEQIEFADDLDEDDYEGICDSLAGAELDRDYD